MLGRNPLFWLGREVGRRGGFGAAEGFWWEEEGDNDGGLWVGDETSF